MTSPIAPAGQDAVHAAIRRAADATGVNFSWLVETARRESALNLAANPEGVDQLVDVHLFRLISQ